jgi:hypothetical protein
MKVSQRSLSLELTYATECIKLFHDFGMLPPDREYIFNIAADSLPDQIYTERVNIS